jgi:hypothetical protein
VAHLAFSPIEITYYILIFLPMQNQDDTKSQKNWGKIDTTNLLPDDNKEWEEKEEVSQKQ